MTKKILKGKVIKDKNNKTVVVLVKRRFSHSFFDKVMTSSKKYHAHDEANAAGMGDTVVIVEASPYSRTKRWRLQTISEKAQA